MGRKARRTAKAQAKAAAKRVKSDRWRKDWQDSEAICNFTAGCWTGQEFSAPSATNNLGGICGHCIVAAGERIWCLGGWREEREDREARAPSRSRRMSVWELRLESKSWMDVTPDGDGDGFPCWRWGHSSCLVPGRSRPSRSQTKLWLAGGFNSHCNLNDVWRFCPKEGTFSTVASEVCNLPYHAAYHSLVFDDVAQQLFLFGGQCCVGGPYRFFDCGLFCTETTVA